MPFTRGQMMEFPLTLTHILSRTKKIVATREICSKTLSGKIHTYTFGDCYRRICQLGHALKRLGIQSGDRIGTLAWNTHEHLELYYAVPCLGAVIHTLNLRFSPEQLSYIIQHAEDRILFVDASLVPLLEKIAPTLTCVEKYVILGGSSNQKTSLSPVFFYEDLLKSEKEEFDWPELDENQAAGLCYTSGTTGNPKGALYSHRSQYLHTLNVSLPDVLGLRASDTILSVVPMFHANAWGIPYAAAAIGCRIVLPGAFLKPADLAEIIQNQKVTLAAGVLTLWFGLYQELKNKKYDTSALRALLVGGAPMPRSLIQAFEEEFKLPVVHAWGMTELSPLGTSSGLLENSDITPEQKYDLKAQQGLMSPCVELRIVGESGQELPWDGKSMGELQVRGTCVISSYYKDSDRSAFTEDGWFNTGDVATLDPDGRMAITDRSKDLIKSGGEWISSVALENALMAHPQILEAAVVAISDERWGERPLALFVPKKGMLPTVEALQSFLGSKFSKFWIPERFEMVAEIPKTSVGKFDKKEIRNRIPQSTPTK